jgi:hypothetical protein
MIPTFQSMSELIAGFLRRSGTLAERVVYFIDFQPVAGLANRLYQRFAITSSEHSHIIHRIRRTDPRISLNGKPADPQEQFPRPWL